jgi:hypothetical protein
MPGLQRCSVLSGATLNYFSFFKDRKQEIQKKMSQPRKRYYVEGGLGELGGALNMMARAGNNYSRHLEEQKQRNYLLRPQPQVQRPQYQRPQVQPQPQVNNQSIIVLRKPSPTEIFNSRISGKPLYEKMYVNGRVMKVLQENPQPPF